MDIASLLSQMGGASALARNLNISTEDASRGAQALLPSILGGFQKQSQAQGLAGLGGMVDQLGGSGLLDNLLGSKPAEIDRGNNVLGQIFGSREVSRAVADDAAAKSGLNPAVLKKMLPMLAMMVTGYMAKQKAASSSGLGSLVGGLLGGGGSAGGLGALTSMLGGGKSESASSENPLDAILRNLR